MEKLDLHERERRLRDAIVKESQKLQPNEEVLNNLRRLHDSVRMQLGYTVSESGRLYQQEPQARASEKKTYPPVADPSAVLNLRQQDTGAALRIDITKQRL